MTTVAFHKAFVLFRGIHKRVSVQRDRCSFVLLSWKLYAKLVCSEFKLRNMRLVNNLENIMQSCGSRQTM